MFYVKIPFFKFTFICLFDNKIFTIFMLSTSIAKCKAVL